jgi:peptide chain release factor 3
LLFKNEWNYQQVKSDHPELQLNNIAPVVSGQEPESI